MRTLKTTLEQHPIYLILTLLLAILGLIFLTIEIHDHFKLNLF